MVHWLGDRQAYTHICKDTCLEVIRAAALELPEDKRGLGLVEPLKDGHGLVHIGGGGGCVCGVVYVYVNPMMREWMEGGGIMCMCFWGETMPGRL